MKLFLVITLFLGLAWAAPSDVEIVKQRLIRFPEDPSQSQTSEQADETRRILDEINKINAALGYVKKEDESRNKPVLLDSDKYLFPKPPSTPIEWKFHNGGQFPGAFRQFSYDEELPQHQPQQFRAAQSYPLWQNPFQQSHSQQIQQQLPIARKIIHQHSVMIPQPFSAQPYYYPEPYLRAPFREAPKFLKSNDSNADTFGSNMIAVSNDITSIVEYARKLETESVDITAANNEEFEKKLLNNVHKIINEAKEKKPKAENINKSEKATEKKLGTNIKFVAIPAKGQTYPGIIVARKPSSTVPTSTQKPTAQYKPAEVQSKPTIQRQSLAAQNQRLFQKHRLTQNKQTIQNGQTPQKQTLSPIHEFTHNQPLPQNTEKTIQVKNPLSVLVRPFPQFFKRPTTPEPLPEPTQNLYNDDPDYENDDAYSNDFPSAEKGIFQQALDNQKEVLKSGGVLIQKLRVRKGGIAIAGPGGVATAGSGGTAIIGPGGVALTHPRSLTIAGPGAKIVALPETYDLEKAVWETSARTLPPEGVVVATGPTIYYSP